MLSTFPPLRCWWIDNLKNNVLSVAFILLVLARLKLFDESPGLNPGRSCRVIFVGFVMVFCTLKCI